MPRLDWTAIIILLKVELKRRSLKWCGACHESSWYAATEDINSDRIPANFLCQTISKLEDK